ncbi:type II secretion system protein E [Oceanococcus atlanticus]|uniref:Type II secretion system protein E n=1 Tax=Oceanococcus atlanticus TaxID=1317117 RepID=A0A1Y1SHP4_9GAMM|nr:type II secretion system protein E [Oceanococcus atlanticus]RZO85126.1 MAG: CpaF family protein [Oceanococcus sp.]
MEGQTGFRLSDQYLQLKSRLHRHLIGQIEERDLQIADWPRTKLRQFVDEHVRRYVVEQRLPVNTREASGLAQDVEDELIGFGPLQSLVDDESIADIVVNGPNKVFVERDGRLSAAPVRFADNAHVTRIVQRILAPIGRRIDESNPMVDARLPDGSRVNAIIPPVALDGPCVSIRKFRREPLNADDLVRYGSVSRDILDFLSEAVANRRSLIVVGGTGSGKTTFLNLLSQWIPHAERVITIEDAAELRLENEHVVRLETRPANLEGHGEVSARDLVRNALRMRPDRIVLGEVRGDEVLDMLQAMNTGHEGSMTTLHANSPKDALHRLELLAGFAGFNGDQRMLGRQIGSALDLLVQLARLPDGRRRVTEVCELRMEDDQLTTRPLFRHVLDNDSFERV